MERGDQDSLLLGKNIPVVDHYAPELLCPIPREDGRAELPFVQGQPFYGCDLWHAYEISWLEQGGRPTARVGRFVIPADSPNMVESKSFKLYLNSHNNMRYHSEQDFVDVLKHDLDKLIGAPVDIMLFGADDARLAGMPLDGECIDANEVVDSGCNPRPDLLQIQSQEEVEQVLYSHLLRSLCPVTGQPDWASVRIGYKGQAIDPRSVLNYLLSFRRHQEFHEQCVERLFCDILSACGPEQLEVQAFYTRRGGLDINPYRSTDPAGCPLSRLNRQ